MKIVEIRARWMKKASNLVIHTKSLSGNLHRLARWNIPVYRKCRNRVNLLTVFIWLRRESNGELLGKQ